MKPLATQICTPANRSCPFSGQSIGHGESVPAYQSASVPFGSQCVLQERACSNGTLSGTYTYAACTPEATLSIPQPLVGFWSIANQFAPGVYINDTADVSNVALIPPDQNFNYLPRVATAVERNLKIVLMIRSTLFSDYHGNLYPNFRARFDALWDSLGVNQSSVVGFYLIDEPYLNNDGATTAKLTESQLKANLESASGYVKQKAPQRLVMLTEGYPQIERATVASLFPANIDYIGVNCYLSFSVPCSESALPALITKLSSGLSSGQKMMITADGYFPTLPTEHEDALIRSRIVFWEQLIAPYMASQKIGAFTPFIYQTVPGSAIYGCTDMPKAREEVFRYMTSVKNGNPSPGTKRNLTAAAATTVSSSGEYQSNVAKNAIDASLSTYWNAGGYAPQWLQLDLGAPRQIDEILLTIGQSPAGHTTHNVYASPSGAPGSWSLVSTFSATTSNGELLRYTPVSPLSQVRFIKIETTESPSRVGWPEITIVGS